LSSLKYGLLISKNSVLSSTFFKETFLERVRLINLSRTSLDMTLYFFEVFGEEKFEGSVWNIIFLEFQIYNILASDKVHL